MIPDLAALFCLSLVGGVFTRLLVRGFAQAIGHFVDLSKF